MGAAADGGNRVRLRITVIGTGYLGAVHAACLADLGFEVLGVDSDPAKVAALSAGRVPFYEPGLADVLTRATESGRLSFTTDYAKAAEFGDVHFLCVGTPQLAGSHGADLAYVDGAIEQLGPLLTRPCLIVGKSTVPVGTAARVAARLMELAPAGAAAELAWNPEFLREGFAVEDTLRPDRLVFGVTSPGAEATLREVYEPMLSRGTPLVITDFQTAELVKVAANSFLATKISFINAMAEICEATGADVRLLADALGHDDRIGRKFLNAGLGFGGGCLPKDIRAFMARAGEIGRGESLLFLREVDEINLRRRARVVELARELVGGDLLAIRVACLGAAFKPNSDDIRDSPALDVAAAIQLQGAQVSVYDPKAAENGRRAFPTLHFADTLDAATDGADIVLLLTEWSEFRELDPETLGRRVASRRIIDARNVLDPSAWRATGWHYRALGRP